MPRRKILIIKPGLIETIGNEENTDRVVSLGDIIRTTPILHLYKDDDVAWVTVKEGAALVRDNPHIKRVFCLGDKSLEDLQKERFDIIVNLEKDRDICLWTDSLKGEKRFGFHYDRDTGLLRVFDLNFAVLDSPGDHGLRRVNRRKWVEILFALIGEEWKGEDYLLGYKPKTKEKFDLGFNVHVGKKWTNKRWPDKGWKELEKAVREKYTYSYQRSLENLEGYMDWVNSCRLLITNDSLGMHLALALRKKTVVIFGPTSSSEIEFYGRGRGIHPETGWDCIPCFRPECQRGSLCVETVSAQKVKEAVDELF